MRILTIIAIFLSFISHGSGFAESIKIKGVYGNPKQLWQKEPQLSKLGINAIFVRSGLINDTLIDTARSDGLKIFAEFATLNGKNYVDQHPEAWAIDEQGNKVEPASWFMGVCPTEPGFRQYRIDLLTELLSKYKIDGVWLDYVHWHAQFEEPKPILPETCFCENCLNSFSKYSGTKLAEGTTPDKAKQILNNHDQVWREWRCQVVFDWVSGLGTIMKEMQPEALLGLYHCPWNDNEYDGARRRILGLDLDMLKETVDVFSPMVYHARKGREPEWVRTNVQWLCRRLDIGKSSYPKVWPIVQAHNSPRIVTPEEFESVLRYGLSGNTSGVMMFTATAIAEDPAKAEVVKKVYSSSN